MANKIVSDSFETLGTVVKQVGDDIAENIGLKPQTDIGTVEQSSQQQQQQAQADQAKKMAAELKASSRKKYQVIRAEIKQLQGKRSQEMVKYSQPGFTDEQKQQNQVKQLEEKKELPPLPAQRAQRKTEMLRGVSG